MIIKQTRIQTSGFQNIKDHVLSELNNERVAVIAGDFEQLENADIFAEMRNHKYSIRHLIVSPDEQLSASEFQEFWNMFREEFNVQDRSFVAIAHEKLRSNNTNVTHFHVLISEADSCAKVLDSYNLYKRNEKLAREAEVRFGHKINKGRHNVYAVEQLRKQNKDDIVEKLESAKITESALPNSAYSSRQLRKAERFDVDLPKFYRAIMNIDSKEFFNEKSNLEEEFGITIKKGDRKDVFIATKADENEKEHVICNITRFRKDLKMSELIKQHNKDAAEKRKFNKQSYSKDAEINDARRHNRKKKHNEKPENVNNRQQYSKELVEYLSSRHNTIKQRERNNRNEKETTISKNSNSKIDFKRNQQDNNPRNSEKSGDDSRDQTNSSELPRTVRSRAEPRRAEQDRRTAGADSPGTTSNERTSSSSRAKPDRSNQYLQAIQQRIKNAKFRRSALKQHHGHADRLSQISQTPPADFPVLESQDVNNFLKKWAQSTQIGMRM